MNETVLQHPSSFASRILPRILTIAILIIIPLFLNAWYPRLRFENAAANYLFGIALCFTPFLLALAARRARPRRVWLPVTIAGLLATPVLGLLIIYATFRLTEILADGRNNNMIPMQEVWQGPIRVRSYAIGEFGLYVRQERQVIPGFLLVRTLLRGNDPFSATLSNGSPGIVHIECSDLPTASSPGGERKVDAKIRSFFVP